LDTEEPGTEGLGTEGLDPLDTEEPGTEGLGSEGLEELDEQKRLPPSVLFYNEPSRESPPVI
jgi:hypothetical protein